MNYGPQPWRQHSWDWRAAANFICGGAGGGLLVIATLAAPATGPALRTQLVGLGLVAFGLLCVWTEIGRPWRALNVFRNPRSSWMAREAWVAALLFASAIGVLLLGAPLAWLTAALALAFVYSQARMLQACKGIPAWRVPAVVPLLLVTGLAEGGGLWLLLAGAGGAALLLAVAILLAARVLLVRRWFAAVAPRRATGRVALDHAALVLQWGGGWVPLFLLLVALTAPSAAPARWLGLIAGLLAAGSGAWFKFILVTRGAFNQGFALAQRPVRGGPMTGPS